MTYLEFDFAINPFQPVCDILVAELSAIGFESFLEGEDRLLAYIKSDDFTGLDKVSILKNPEFKITWASKEIAQQNWNAAWERSFQPIELAGQCRVRAPFHPPKKIDHDIVIEPKMSFGTGHHETTYMMLQHILDYDLNGKSVLDMGCGTGVLAILAEKRGAKKVEAIDIDPWCYENTLENVSRNDCKRISVYLGDSGLLKGKEYDMVMANINRNILLSDMAAYAKTLTKNGCLFLSGFYKSDMATINETCEALHLKRLHFLEKNDWVAAVYRIS